MELTGLVDMGGISYFTNESENLLALETLLQYAQLLTSGTRPLRLPKSRKW